MTGSVYVQRGQPVTVLARWRAPGAAVVAGWLIWHGPPHAAPRNVVIERTDGSLAVRPFRGLRKVIASTG